MDRYGHSYVATLALAREDDEETVTLAAGMALADRAERAASRSAPCARTA